jgi:hypothetical protein
MDMTETLTMQTTDIKRAYNKPVLRRLGLLRRLTRFTF